MVYICAWAWVLAQLDAFAGKIDIPNKRGTQFVQGENEPLDETIVSLRIFNLLRPRKNEGVVHVQSNLH